MSAEQSPFTGLTPEEQAVADALVQAWNAFLKIPEGMPVDDMQKFRDAVHDAERIIAYRAMARMYPKYWR